MRLFLLAGVPVVGALVLAAVIAQDARQRAASAAALGSVEDLASLSSQMSATMFALHAERVQAAIDEGATAHEATRAELERQYRITDVNRGHLERLLARRDMSALPPRLARELGEALSTMASLPAFRAKIAAGAASIDEILEFYGAIDESLIEATAALSHLSDDGQILRNISALVAISELTERVSIEHALLANVAARKQFAPGMFKLFVTLGTEQAIYRGVFRANAPEELVRRWDAEQQASSVRTAFALRDKVLASTDDAVELDERAWFDAEQARITMLDTIANLATDGLSSAATRKVESTRASIRLGIGLSIAVVILSTILAHFIRRGISNSIIALSSAAERVQATKDFSVRAVKLSGDELGTLADAFNEMLAGVQARDAELESHRQNLEGLVDARTKELGRRNNAMRIVLDNVEQGLAKISVDGTLQGERSAKFDALLGAPTGTTTFAAHLGPEGSSLRAVLEFGWEMVTEGLFPVDVALDQLPTRMERDGRHFKLGFRPIVNDEVFDGALLVVTDITAELEARREEEKQREHFAIFQRVAQDRDGFIAFCGETSELFERLAQEADDVHRIMAIVHTIKGNAAQWAVTSVAHAAHEIESQLDEVGELPSDTQRAELALAWKTITDRFNPIVGEAEGRIDVSPAEIASLLADIHNHESHGALAAKVERFYDEPATTRLHRMTEAAARVAERLGKPAPHVVVEAEGVRLPAEEFSGFWASMVHVVRNMVDHGIESAEARARAGKDPVGSLLLRATETADRVTIECSDDGAGIDWAAIARKAQAAGLPSRTPEDLEAALFASGISTAKEVTDISGRGVGLSAVLDRCHELGGTATVSSTRGQGTRFSFSFARRLKRPLLTQPQLLQRAS